MRSLLFSASLLLITSFSCKERASQFDEKGNPFASRTSKIQPNTPNQNDLDKGKQEPQPSKDEGDDTFTPSDPGQQDSSNGSVKGSSKGNIGVTQAPPSGMHMKGGKEIAPPDYQTCVGLPTVGKQKYPAKCQTNYVMAVINDGKAQEMTCCPLVGKSILSDNPAEQYIQRTGKCLENEVGVGMISAKLSTLYCTKINAQYLKLTTPVTALYAKSNAALTPVMKSIAASYNIHDTCICPEKTILIGNHSPQDNVCRDLCVEIVAK